MQGKDHDGGMCGNQKQGKNRNYVSSHATVQRLFETGGNANCRKRVVAREGKSWKEGGKVENAFRKFADHF